MNDYLKLMKIQNQRKALMNSDQKKKCFFIQILKRFLEIVQSVQSLSSYKYEDTYLAKRK